jgi:hypothetical protein
MALTNLAYADDRREGRDEVHHRARATGRDGRQLPLLIVNLSPSGLMARCDAHVGIGEQIRLPLPLVGHVVGDVRWALGGRIGCQFLNVIPLAGYRDLLAAITRG